MPRIQILELPEGADDRRPPYVLVVDEYVPQRVIVGPGTVDPWRDQWAEVAKRIGARGVLVFPDAVEIPANDVSAELRAGLQESVGELYESARQSLSESETLGHRLLQRAENAEGRSRAMEVQRDRAEAGRVAADNMLRAVCEVFGGPHQDPVVKARETLSRAEDAESKLEALTARTHRRDTEHMGAITDALGFDRLRGWDEIISVIKRDRLGGHEFGGPGFNDPVRCRVCGLDAAAWDFRRDRRPCADVQAANGGE